MEVIRATIQEAFQYWKGKEDDFSGESHVRCVGSTTRAGYHLMVLQEPMFLHPAEPLKVRANIGRPLVTRCK